MNKYQRQIKLRRLFCFLGYLVSVATIVIWLSSAMDHSAIAQTDELVAELEVVAEFPEEHPHYFDYR